MARKYPPEVHAFIVENYEGRTSEELAEMVNIIFGTAFTKKSILSYKKNYHLRSGCIKGTKKGTTIKYPEGVIEFIKDECHGLNTEETAAAVNKRFGSGTMTPDQVRAFRKNHKIPSGVDTRFKPGQASPNRLKKGEYYPGCEKTWFKKGNKPHNEVEVGTHSRTTDGYQIIKVTKKGTQRERWEFLARHVWKEHFGDIPDGYMVGFKDGDPDNMDPDNLFLLTNEENLEMNRKGKRSKFPEITQARLNVAKVQIAARNRRRKRKEGSKNGTVNS